MTVGFFPHPRERQMVTELRKILEGTAFIHLIIGPGMTQ